MFPDNQEHGQHGNGLKLNVENGVYGDILIITGKEELGLGLTTNQTETVERFEILKMIFYSIGVLGTLICYFIFVNSYLMKRSKYLNINDDDIIIKC